MFYFVDLALSGPMTLRAPRRHCEQHSEWDSVQDDYICLFLHHYQSD